MLLLFNSVKLLLYLSKTPRVGGAGRQRGEIEGENREERLKEQENSVSHRVRRKERCTEIEIKAQRQKVVG